MVLATTACGGPSAGSSKSGVVTVIGAPASGQAGQAADAGEPVGACGLERWAVKTGTDPDAGQIDLNTSTPTTVANLRIITPPSDLPALNRIKPTETSIFVVSAELTEFKLESDSDIHLVLTDSGGYTMIAEIPAPHCVSRSSPFAGGVGNARAQFDARYEPTAEFKQAGVPVKIRGVGFFDFQHGQAGVAPNAIELHPVLDITFPPTA